jgi:glycosyltransferase involved in cell wall biosynthesis
VDLNEFKPQDNDEKILRRDFTAIGEVLVGIVGRIDPSKRQLEFLQAAEKVLKNSAKSISFFIIGEVHHPGYFEQLKKFISEKGLDKHVVFTGRRDDIPQVLNSLDVLVSFSGGSVMFEAAACGRAVISAGFNGDRDPLSIKYLRGRPIVSVTETCGLVEALIRLINDSELRKRIGREARNWAQNHFCHIAMAAKTQKLYEKLLS